MTTASRHNLLVRSFKAANAVLLDIPFAFCWWTYFAPRMLNPFYFYGNVVVVALFIVFYVSFGRIYDSFKISINSIPQMIYSQVLALLMADGLMFIVIWLLTFYFPNIWVCLFTLFQQILLVIIWCFISNRWYFHSFPPKKTGIIFDKRVGLDNLISDSELAKKYDVIWVKNINEVISDMSVFDDIEVVFISGVHSHERNNVLKYCVEKDVDMFVIPNLGDVILSGGIPSHMFHLPMVNLGRYNPDFDYLLAKRCFDILVSGIALVVLSPLILITSIAIKGYDRGPVFYKQKRLTKDGKIFDVLKFRSMRVDAEKDGVARLSSGDNDDRITPVGRFIRKVRIDELPQLINILVGDMSIVGPRPERPEIAQQYLENLPEFNLRLQAKAGLTGYAQVYGKYNTTPYDKLSMDLMYIAHPGFLEDLRIIFATIKILFLPESTEGVAEGKTTAQ